MTLKTKLISTISAFVLILTIVIVGVWAASTANISLGGTVNFQATNVYAKVSGKVTGMDSNPTLPTLIFSEGADASSETDIEKWSDLDLLFNSSATPIEISVTVENLSTERWLLVDIIEGLDNGKSDNINKEVKKENSDYTLGETHTLVPSTGDGTSKVEFTITLTVDNSNYSADTIYSYIINLNNSNEAPPEPAKELEFTFDGNKVTGYTGSEANITIPTSYSMEKTPYNSFVLTEEELSGQPSSETLNKMGMLYALKNYTIYPNGQTEGILCENGFMDAMSYIMDSQYFPIKVELPEDLTFELTEAELEREQEPDEPDETELKKVALEFLQNFYVQFGENSEEILCQDYDDFVSKLDEIMLEGPKPEYFPLKFRIDYASYKYVEGDDYQVEAIGNFSLTPSTSEPVVLTIPSAISIDPLAFSDITHEFSIVFEEGRTEIPNQTFMNCSALKGIVFPNSMQKIGERAFYGCTGITELTIPANITEIGLYAFNNCTGITKLTYDITRFVNEDYTKTSNKFFGSNFASPEGFELIVGPNVEEIPMAIFANYENLTTVTFNSEKLSYVGIGAFYGCTNLQTNSYEGGIYLGKGTNPCYLLLTVEDKTVENFVIAETCEIIGGGEVLDGCTNLKSIVIPNSVTSICGNAFSNCGSLQTVTIGPESELEIIGPLAFKECTELRNFNLPSKLKYIGANAFSRCSSLTSVTIPASVVSIDELFGYSLTEIFSSPGEVVSYELMVGVNPFEGVTLDKIVVKEGNKFFKSVDDKALLSIDGKILYTYAAGDAAESYTIPSGVEIVGAGAFYLSENLKTVVIPNTTKTIGSSAFVLSGLISITIPKSVDKIGVAAFGECKSLVSVYFGEGSNIQNIYGYSFYGCGSLEEISLPNTIKTIGEYAFANCQAIDTLIFENDIEFERRAFDESKATTVILGSELTEIPDIFGPSDLQALNIVIEENSKITTIENGMFQDITELKTFIVKENSSLTTIESSAFDGCSSLTSITIPEGVTSIGSSAFYNCSSLTSVSLPSMLTSIGGAAFSGCSSLEAFNGDGNEYYTIDDNRALLVDGGKTLLAYARANTEPSYTIPKGVTSIGDYAFRDCSSLTSISIPERVTEIGWGAFEGCNNLTSISIPAGVTSIGYYTFRDCSSLTSVSLPSMLTSIGNSAFESCSSLTTIQIPERVTEIGLDAFSYCYALTIVYNNSSLNITAGSSGNGYVARYAKEIVTSGNNPAGRIEIEGDIQYYVTTEENIALAPSVPRGSLTSTTIREGTTEINQYAFYFCSSLTSITIPKGVTSIGSSAFRYCSSLTSILIPEGVTSIVEYAFWNCYALAIVYNNSSLEITAGSYDNGAVGLNAKEIVSSGEKAVGKIEIADDVQYYVNEQTGENIALAPSVPRDSLTSVTIRKGTTGINPYAFENCSRLTTITIPEGVTSIGSSAFDGCSSLTSITIPEGVTSIGSFSGCSSLTTITIPEGVTSIGYEAFYNCSSLTSVSLPSTLTSINSFAFSGCSKLTEITINGNITSLGTSAFSSCSKLTSLTLGAGVTSLPDNLFDTAYLSKLTEIVVLGDLTSETFPRGTWIKDGVVVTSFDGPGTYTRTNVL